jgi:hypothetical protein
MFIPDPDFYPSRIPDLDPGSNENKKRRRGKFVVLFFCGTNVTKFKNILSEKNLSQLKKL